MAENLDSRRRAVKFAKRSYQMWFVIAVCSFVTMILTLLTYIKIIKLDFNPVSGIIISGLVLASAISQCIAYKKDEKITYERAVSGMEDEVYDIYEKVKKSMADIGIDQWDELYPNKNDIVKDIRNDEFYLMKKGGKIIGCYCMNKEQDTAYNFGDWKDKDGKYYIIHRLCIHPDYQGLGYGRMVMLHIEEQAKELGATSIRLDVFTKNESANSLYNGLGYQYAGDAYWRKGKFSLMEKVI